MNNFTLLYKPFLYREEEEFNFFGLEVPHDFWSRDNLSSIYQDLFAEKLKYSAIRMFENYLNSDIYPEELFQEIAWSDKDDYCSIFKKYTERVFDEFFEDFFNIIEDTFVDDSYALKSWNDGTIETTINHLMQTDLITEVLSDFTERLLIIKNNENILKYYNGKYYEEIFDNNKESEDDFYKRIAKGYFSKKFTEKHFDGTPDSSLSFSELMNLYKYLYY